ncbi:MAG: hypothetical protein M1822_006593 [Bathelium mastoideum]|nr:MAG: hypothetical protein M1822_006593 [Bathelium mastoideum]
MSPGAPVTGDTGPGGEHGSTSQDVLDTDLFTHAHPTEEERLSDGGKKQESIRRTEEAVNGWAEKDLKNILEPKQRILSSERLKPNVEAILDFEKQQLPISPEQTALNGDASRDLEKQEADASSKTSARKEEIAIIDESQDSNIVDWDGPDGPPESHELDCGKTMGHDCRCSGVFTAMAFLLLKETSGIAILAAKTRRLRRETGNPQLRSRLDNGLSPRDLFLRSIVRPTKMLTRSPIVFLLSLYVAVVYAYLYLLFTTFTPVYEEQYGFSLGTAGLSYLGIGVGAFSGQFVNTHFGNRLVRGRMERGTFKPEHRLPLMVPGAICVPVGLFWYGWSAQARTHWIVPIIGTGFVGFGLLLTFMPATTYLVDVFTIYAASAMAANTVLRSVFAAILPLAGQDMYAALGLGWGNSLLGFIALALMPTPLIFMRYGEKIRTKYPVKL